MSWSRSKPERDAYAPLDTSASCFPTTSPLLLASGMALPPLSLEPVPSTSAQSSTSVDATQAAHSSSAPSGALLQPPPELKDVSAEGELVYDSSPNQQPLAERLARLWAERGDFARLDYAGLKEAAAALGDVGEQKESAHDWGAPREEEKEADNEGEAKGKESTAKGDLTQAEMEALKGQMWRKLHEAHHALYMSHSLVSLMMHSRPSTRAAPSSRADSPAVAASSSGQPRAPGSIAGRGVSSAPPGTQAALLEELGLEGTNIGVSTLSLRNTTGMQSANGRLDDAEEAEEADDDADLPRYRAHKEAARLAKADATLTAEEAETRARALVGTHHSARQGILKAVAVLNAGAEQMRRVLPPSAGGGEAGEAEARRWEGLKEARLNGWGVTPGSTSRTLRQQQREDGAKDAWVGWAVPEAQPRYKFNALAYFSPTLSAPVAPAAVAVNGAPADADAMALDEPIAPAGLAAAAAVAGAGGDVKAPAHGLVFVGRQYKRLRAAFVHKAEDGTENVWSSDSTDEDEEEANGVDAELRRAQEEQADAELFYMLIAEARTLTKAAHVYSTVSQRSVSIDFNAHTSLRFELVPTSAPDKPAAQRPAKPLPARARAKAAEEKEEQPTQAALARLLLAYMKLGLVQRYKERAAGSAGKTRPERARAPLLEPVLGLIHYASFIASLREALEAMTKEAGEAATFSLSALDSVASVRDWALPLLQGKGDEATAALGGVATLRLGDDIIAKLNISFPSNITLHLPLRRTAGGTRGVIVPSLTLDSAVPLLKRELDDNPGTA